MMINKFYKYKFIIIRMVNNVNNSLNSLKQIARTVFSPVDNSLNKPSSFREQHLFTFLSTAYSPTYSLKIVNNLSK